MADGTKHAHGIVCQPEAEETHTFSGTGIPYLLPEEQRDFAIILGALCTDDKCREEFWKDPAGALGKRNISVKPGVIDAVCKADRKIMDKIVENSADVLTRAKGLTWEGETVAVVPFVVAAFLAGALAGALLSEMYHHRV